MKRALIFGFAVLFGCSHGSSYSGGTASTPPARSPDQQTAVVQPSELSSEQVRLVQRALSDRGFALDLTGTFDQRTQSALGDFQRTRGLPATGNLNQPTVEALGLDPRDVMPVRGTSDAHGGRRETDRAKTDTSDRVPGAPPSKPDSAPGTDRDSSSSSSPSSTTPQR